MFSILDIGTDKKEVTYLICISQSVPCLDVIRHSPESSS